MSQNPSRINAPLNFRTTNALITTKVPHYPTKDDTGTQIVPGWNRPNANGINSNISSSDYNGPNFKARPLKHWRRQLRSYNSSDPCVSSLNVWSKTQSNLDPGSSFLFVSASSDGTKAVGGGYAIIIPPSFPSNIAGLWYTNDSGKTWNQSEYSSNGLKINTGLFNVSMSSDGTYAVAGNYFPVPAALHPEGIWYSSDGGQTWSQSNKSNHIYQYICISGDGKTAIAGSNDKLPGTDYGISYSSDYGQNWNASNFNFPFQSLTFTNVSISYDGKNAIAIQTKNDVPSPTNEYKIWYSTSYGVTWFPSATPISTTIVITHISISKYGLKAIAATSGQGLYYSTDGGVSFTQSNNTNGTFYYTSLSDTGLKAIACGSSGIWYSSNGGQTWANGSLLSSYIAVISGDGKKAIAGTTSIESGLQYSNNSGAYWSQVSTNTVGSFSTAQNFNNMVINNNGTRAIAGGSGDGPLSGGNGMWYSICTADYYNYSKFTSNRTVTISELERPGVTVYHYNPVCECGDEGGNSYIVANNKFVYKTKVNQFSDRQTDVKIQNNGFNAVPHDATRQMINDPTNPAYEVLTGVYNTNCINCSPQNNVIKPSIAFISQAYFADSRAKQQSRCQTYEQNISTNRVDGIQYFNNNQPLWPDNSPLGPQVVAPLNYTPSRLYDKPCLSQTIYKPNNVAFAKQGAVSGSTRITKLVSDTMTINGNSFYSAAAAVSANFGSYQGTNTSGNYYVKKGNVQCSC